MYKLVLSDEARKAYAAADAPLARKLAKCFARIESGPRDGNNVKSLKGSLAGYWRYRVGDYRVVYSINDASHIVSVVTIAHRQGVYD
jgi:mRNA interferase RelE/StbE